MISRGNIREVPNVVDLTQAQAEARLEERGFRVNVREGEPSDDPGKVVSQDPDGGQQRPRNSTVTIIVSTEQEQDPPPSDDPSATPTEEARRR
jgi:serine/threonine-protein kinase